MEELTQVGIETLAAGAVPERFNDALAEVLANIDDPNTEPKAKRKIRLDIVFSPSEGRDSAAIDVRVQTTLATVRPVGTVVHLTRREGRLVALQSNFRQEALPFNPKVVEK